MKLLSPERYFSRISDIDIPHDLLDVGISHVLLDFDNTILSRATHDIPPDALRWIEQAKQAGITLCIVSNNWHASPFDVARTLDIAVVAKACKPLPFGLLVARGKVGARSNNAVVVGDQLSTDVLGAHLLGMRAWLVCPLAEEDLKHSGAVRRLERSLIGSRLPEGAPACEGSSFAVDYSLHSDSLQPSGTKGGTAQ